MHELQHKEVQAVICVTKKRNPLHYDYSIGSTCVPKALQEKDLGVLVAHNMSWNDQVRSAVGKAHKMLGLIYRTCDDCDRQTLLTLYRSLVRPQLEYATQVWSPSGIGNTKLIQRVQRRATRFILKSNDDYPSRLQKLGLLPLLYRRELFLLDRV